MTSPIDTSKPFQTDQPLAPYSESWEVRRDIAQSLRVLSEQLLTANAPLEQLKRLQADLKQAQALLADSPQLLGRMNWDADAGDHGNYSSLSREVTPIAGYSNVAAPPLAMWMDDKKAYGKATMGWVYEGPPGCVHGGMVAALFDEFLGCAQLLTNRAGATGTLTVRYHKPTPLAVELRLEASVKSVNGRKIVILGEMWAGDVMTASCEGLFISFPEGVKHLAEHDQKKP